MPVAARVRNARIDIWCGGAHQEEPREERKSGRERARRDDDDVQQETRQGRYEIHAHQEGHLHAARVPASERWSGGSAPRGANGGRRGWGARDPHGPHLAPSSSPMICPCLCAVHGGSKYEDRMAGAPLDGRIITGDDLWCGVCRPPSVFWHFTRLAAERFRRAFVKHQNADRQQENIADVTAHNERVCSPVWTKARDEPTLFINAPERFASHFARTPHRTYLYLTLIIISMHESTNINYHLIAGSLLRPGNMHDTNV